jgi:hypothetical protein
MGTVLDWISVVLLAVGAILLVAARKSVEVAASNAAADVVKRVTWAGELARELQKVRGTERQEARLASYGELWSRMRPTAIYDRTPFTRTMIADLAAHLSDWYFSPKGGLMLTTPARELYFTLQDLLHRVSADDWTGQRTERTRSIFVEFLERNDMASAKAFIDFLDVQPVEGWPPNDVVDHAKGWRADIQRIPPLWPDLDATVKFAVVQQVASVLRTALSADVESRLR